jgi:hypothetical protein
VSAGRKNPPGAQIAERDTRFISENPGNRNRCGKDQRIS